MNKEEVRHFKLFTARTQVSGQRKDVLLFDTIRKRGEEYDEQETFKKLYPEDSKNAFYRLKNRLLGDINKSLVLQHLDNDDTITTFHLLSLARFFHTRSNYQIAYHYIKKAEKKAIRLESFELLDFIYSEFIKLSHEILSINPEVFVQKRKENRDHLRRLREIEDILAIVIYRIKVTQNFSNINPLFDLLEETVNGLTKDETVKASPKLRISIYQSVSRILVARRDYKNLESYLLSTYQSFEEENLFTQHTHTVKLQMLVYLINTTYALKKTEESLKYTEILREEIDRYATSNRLRYIHLYYNTRALNYSRRDKGKAIDTLLEFLEKESVDGTIHELYAYLNLAVWSYDLNKHKTAIKYLIRIYIHDDYKKNDDAFKFKIATFELILRIELGDFENVEKRLAQVRKEFGELLERTYFIREAALISLIEQINKCYGLPFSKELKNDIRIFIDTNSDQETEDKDIISYSDWLKKKIGLS